MSGATPPLPNTPWHGVWLKKGTGIWERGIGTLHE